MADKAQFRGLASAFVGNMSKNQVKILGMMVLHDDGIIALEDEITGKLCDIAYEGDNEAMIILHGLF
jgi:hypothetical protein